MNPTLKKITIAELQIGMFIVEMDISWIKSPFLFHRRAVKSVNDILLLKKSGVKQLTIDLTKSQIEQIQETEKKKDEIVSSSNHNTKYESEKPHQQAANHSEQPLTSQEISPENLDEPTSLLKEELSRTVILKEQANVAFQQINDGVKRNQSISAEEVEPVIDETIASLLRNSQALLTMVHLQRSEEKLFSHSFSVMTLALTFAIKEGVNKEDLKILGIAALLHDIGWAQLPLNLFGKAKKYTVNEMKVVQQHQKIGNIIVAKSGTIPERIKQLMMTHHERIDGSGYPEGLKGEQLDPLAKILILTDYYDEIIHGLLDRPGIIASEALRLLYKEAVNKKLDKLQVESLIKLLGIYPLTSAVELTSGEIGLVIEVNRAKPLVPVVRVMYSADGNALANPFILDLEKDQKNRQIKGIVNVDDEDTDPQNLLVVEEI